MNEERLKAQIVKATQSVGKTYTFSDEHADDEPIEIFFQETHEGTVLFVVFYTLACRYSACLGCNLPATSSLRHVRFSDIMRQVDKVFADELVLTRADHIRKVIVSNQGSVLDEETLSSTALMYLVAKINLHLPKLQVLCLETRPEYVDEAELVFLARAMAESNDLGAQIELAIGFEVYDDKLRNRVFRKGLSFGSFERVVHLAARHNFRLKCYFMQKPVPKMTDEEGIHDVHQAIDYFAQLSREHAISIAMHLNPTYAARGTALQEAFEAGDYTPPQLFDVAKAALYAKGKDIPIYIGLYDEGLAVPGGSFMRDGDEELAAELQRFNSSQDFAILERVCV